MKRCYKCKKSQGENMYHKDRNRIGGLSNVCKKCLSKRYYIKSTPEDKEKNNKRCKDWYKKYGKERYEKNKRKIIMYNKLNMAFRQGVVQKRNVCDICKESCKTTCSIERIAPNPKKRGNYYYWKEYCKDCRRKKLFGIDNKG